MNPPLRPESRHPHGVRLDDEDERGLVFVRMAAEHAPHPLVLRLVLHARRAAMRAEQRDRRHRSGRSAGSPNWFTMAMDDSRLSCPDRTPGLEAAPGAWC